MTDRINCVENARIRVETRLDNLNHPCGFDVVKRVPEGIQPEHDEIICSLPDGMSPDQKLMAELIAAVPEMVKLIDDHCCWCADCDYEHHPDSDCGFGVFWKRIFGEKK